MEPDYPPNGSSHTPVQVELVPEPVVQPVRAKGRRFRTGLLVFLLLALAGSILLNVVLAVASGLSSLDTDRKVREKYHSHNRSGSSKVAIIGLEGLITDGDGFFKHQVDRAREDKNVKAVVVRINSPGGTVNGSDSMYHRLRKLKEESEIPLVVSMGGMAASGGYYAAMAVGDTPGAIFAEPTTWTGSIGVIIPHYSVAELMDRWGIKDNSIMSHPLKDMLSPTKTMTPKERQILQTLVDDTFARFKDIVRNGRPGFRKDPSALDKLATGQVFTAQQARSAGLVDRIGFLDEAIDRAIELAGLDPEEVKVVEYKREANLAALLTGSDSRASAPDLTNLLELTVPRAYYLCTWLPAVAAKP